jgi:hypothetical protein
MATALRVPLGGQDASLARGTAVVDPVLAHQGGWDEMAVFLFPAIFGFGLWWIVKRPGPEEEGEDDPETPQQQPR